MAEAIYDLLRWCLGLVFEALFGSPFLSDATERLVRWIGRSRACRRVLAPVLSAFFPPAFRKTGTAFIHIPKNAGTAMNFALYGRSFGHMTASFLRDVDARAWQAAQSAAILRDPADRTVSAWFHVIAGGATEVRLHPRWRRRLRNIGSFDSYLDFLEAHRGRLDRLEFVCRPQSHFVCDEAGRVIVKNIFLLGRDDARIAAFAAAHGQHPLTRRNWTAKKPIELTDRQRARIADLYADDFRLIDALKKSF